MSYSECVEAAMRRYGIPYIKVKEPGHDAPRGEPFSALLGELCRRNLKLCGWSMYLHQERALQELMAGRSVILASETGSGKTEPVIGYALSSALRDPHFKAIFIYPTKALTGDQVRRFTEYAREAGLSVSCEERGKVKVIKGDVIRYDNDVASYVKRYVKQARLLLTNAEVFHIAVYHRFSRQYPPRDFLMGSKLIVVDELDSYGNSRAGLLIHMLKLLSDKFKLNPQLAIMSATIGESKELERYLGATVVAGQGYRPDNYVYVLLPPGFTGICAKLGITCDTSGPEALNSLKNAMLRALSNRELISTISTQLDVLKGYVPRVLADIVKCHGSTLIFTNSIAEATSLSKEVSNYAGFEVPVHNHLTDKHRRAEIEEGLRTGKLRAAFTVRTLLQGIDIGHIARVVHVGLPRFANVRDFIQREGRKGRSRDMANTESIIVPTSLDDLIVLADLYTWLSRGPERLIFVPDNDFFKLNDVVFGLATDPAFEQELGLTDKEKDRLRGKLSFYSIEHGKVKRVLVTWEGGAPQCKDVDEGTSWSDFINYFQPGAFDSSTDSLVVWYDSKSRVIFEVPVKVRDLREAIRTSRDSQISCGDKSFYMPLFLKRAIEGYYSMCSKLNWKGSCDLEDLVKDYYSGKLWSKILVDLAFTSEGFVRGRVVPRYVAWFLESRDRAPVMLEDGSVIHVFKIGVKIFDPYYYGRPNQELFTYAYAVDLEPRDSAYVDMAMAFIQAVLRKSFGVSLSLINYSYSQGLLKVWESEPVGLLKKLRAGEKVLVGDRELSCESLLSEVKNADVEHDEYMKFLLRYLDPFDFGRDEVLRNLKEVKDVAERFVYYICNVIPAVVENNIILVPREWPPRLTVIDYFNGKYIISGRGQVATADDVESALWTALKIAFPNSLDPFSGSVRIIYYGPSDENLMRMIILNYPLNVIFIDLARALKRLASGDPRPFMLSGIRRKVFGMDDLTELELKVNSETLLNGKADDKVLREVGLKRAETIAWLYNLYTKLSSQNRG
ncbi:DEAD/DEAH box helicase [Acidilobus sp.]|uniref:DEAD/DEAH box helicase n=1 Tax=Acidilobus sp. TaxID=1872109 RepID=UPI003D067A96